MGASAGGPKDEIGNDKDEHSGSAEDHKGDEKHAPGENEGRRDRRRAREADPARAAHAQPGRAAHGARLAGQGRARRGADALGAAALAGRRRARLTRGGRGREGRQLLARSGKPRRRRQEPHPRASKRPPNAFQTPVHVGALGLGGTGMPGGPKLNLNMAGVEAAVGNEQL